MSFDDGFDKPRSERTPNDYLAQIYNSVSDSLVKLGACIDEHDFDSAFYPDVLSAFKAGLTADAWWMIMRDHKTLDAKLRTTPAAALLPPGAALSMPRGYAALALLFMVHAVGEIHRGDTTAAWTYALDARFAADTLLSQICDREMVALHKRGMAKQGAMARLKHSPQQAAKAETFKLWQERHAGHHPELRTNEQFAAECMRRWPALTSAKVILGWCTDWNKQAKRKSQPAS
jgi:hypothetical protein